MNFLTLNHTNGRARCFLNHTNGRARCFLKEFLSGKLHKLQLPELYHLDPMIDSFFNDAEIQRYHLDHLINSDKLGDKLGTELPKIIHSNKTVEVLKRPDHNEEDYIDMRQAFRETHLKEIFEFRYSKDRICTTIPVLGQHSRFHGYLCLRPGIE